MKFLLRDVIESGRAWRDFIQHDIVATTSSENQNFRKNNDLQELKTRKGWVLAPQDTDEAAGQEKGGDTRAVR